MNDPDFLPTKTFSSINFLIDMQVSPFILLIYLMHTNPLDKITPVLERIVFHEKWTWRCCYI